MCLRNKRETYEKPLDLEVLYICSNNARYGNWWRKKTLVDAGGLLGISGLRTFETHAILSNEFKSWFCFVACWFGTSLNLKSMNSWPFGSFVPAWPNVWATIVAVAGICSAVEVQNPSTLYFAKFTNLCMPPERNTYLGPGTKGMQPPLGAGFRRLEPKEGCIKNRWEAWSPAQPSPGNDRTRICHVWGSQL